MHQVVWRNSEVWLGKTCALQKKLYRVVAFRIRRCLALREFHARQGVDFLAAQPKPFSGSDQYANLGRGLQYLIDQEGALNQVLEVVQDKQQLPGHVGSRGAVAGVYAGRHGSHSGQLWPMAPHYIICGGQRCEWYKEDVALMACQADPGALDGQTRLAHAARTHNRHVAK